MNMVRAEFAVHMLNAGGKEKAVKLAELFSELLTSVEAIARAGRELALVKTHLQEACFFAKRAVADLKENQES